AAPLELRRIERADGVAAVVADAEALPAEGIERRDRADLLLRNDLVVDVQLRGSDRLVVVARPLLRGPRADRVPAGRRHRRRHALLGRYAEEVEDEVQRPVPDEQRQAAEARALRTDHTLALGGELDLGQDLERDAVRVGRELLWNLGGAGVVRV